MGLKEERKRAGLTQKELAAAVQLSQSSITDFERGKTSISFENAQRIADVLGCEIGRILGESWIVVRSEEQLDEWRKAFTTSQALNARSKQLLMYLSVEIDKEHWLVPVDPVELAESLGWPVEGLLERIEVLVDAGWIMRYANQRWVFHLRAVV